MKHAKKSKCLLSKSNLSEIVLFSPDLVVSYGPLVDLRSTYKPGQGAVHGTISDQLTTTFPLSGVTDTDIKQSTQQQTELAPIRIFLDKMKFKQEVNEMQIFLKKTINP